MSVLVLWSCGRRQLELHTDGAERVAVLLDGGRVAGLWRLPPRPVRRPPQPRA